MDANGEHPLTHQTDDDYMAADATDRRVALEQACVLFAADAAAGRHAGNVLDAADVLYAWLRSRPTLRPVRLVLRHGPIQRKPES